MVIGRVIGRSVVNKNYRFGLIKTLFGGYMGIDGSIILID